MWLEGRQDVTQDFPSCCIQYFTPGKKNCITVDGEVKYVIAVREPEPGETFDIVCNYQLPVSRGWCNCGVSDLDRARKMAEQIMHSKDKKNGHPSTH